MTIACNYDIIDKDNWRKVFSYTEYEKIITKYKDTIIDFSEVESNKGFCLIRHDVEFDLNRAVDIAKIDKDNNIDSSFLLQVRCNSYNIFSLKNTKNIDMLKSLNRKIGLHLYLSETIDADNWYYVHKEIKIQKDILETALGQEVDRFSFHRPKKWMLQNKNDYILGLINMYGPSFFEFNEDPKNIKYYSDSRHRWSYGHPLVDKKYSKVQMLLHPDEWSKTGYRKNKNFKKLIKDNDQSFKTTLFEETVYKNNER